MGLRLTCPAEASPIPRQVVLELTCDGCGLFPTVQRFEEDGFIRQHDAAMRAGWLERTNNSGRTFLGPCCSGKRKEAA